MAVFSYTEKLVLSKYRQEGIKIGVIPNPGFADPCFFISPAPKTCNPGKAILIAETILDILRISHEKRSYIAVNHTNYGRDGFMKQISNGEFDLGIPQFTITPERQEVAAFSEFVEEKQLYILSRYASLSDRNMFDAFLVFKPYIWQLLVLFAVIVSAAGTINTDNSNIKALIRTWLFNSIDVLCMCLGRTSLRKDQIRSASGSLVIVAWAFSAVVLVGMYSGEILARLVKINVLPPFHDMTTAADCINSRECTMIHYTRTVAEFEKLLG